MDEQELPPSLKKAIERLDVKGHAAANRLDLEKVRAGTLERLKSAPPAAAPLRRYVWRAAAAVALVLAGSVLVTKQGARGLPIALDSLDAADSTAVLAVVNEVAVADSALVSSVVSVDDLNEQELRALLQALENEETL